jgi:hypothetical protein
MQGCKVYRLHLCCRTRHEMLATILAIRLRYV